MYRETFVTLTELEATKRRRPLPPIILKTIIFPSLLRSVLAVCFDDLQQPHIHPQLHAEVRTAAGSVATFASEV